ncbi:UNVERIFIED_CONTAM: Pyridoxal phosphate homeostasis protein [Sesamum radiatum]|uniref:Pyridoxal phosphate homeostasis protein n=1 Tax=Sesamum radiatum TaxID=300843 RepID=A0AAW2LRH3_SESRA
MNNPEAERRVIAEPSQDSPSSTQAEQSSSASPGLQMAAASATDGAAAAALRSVLQRVNQAAERAGRAPERIRWWLGFVSFQLLLAHNLLRARWLPEDIEWHFIGNLQSNKVKTLLTGVPNLAMVETVDDEKIANHLNRAIGNIGRKPLKVLVQVNTSGEESKSGVEPVGCVDLVKHISMNCPNLEFCGLMTIGMPDYTSTQRISRSEVCKALGIEEEQCELSMGMSGDFELAIEMGSTNVRIGSTIFGAREYPKKQ